MVSPDVSRGEALTRLRRAFGEAGLDSPSLDARILVMEALRIDAAALTTHPELPLGAEGANRLSRCAARRLAREPVARILGEREFWGLPFALSPETLVPRPETETVVRAALAHIHERRAPVILDLGTGTGCLLVSLLHERPDATGVGVDRAMDAVGTALRNALRNGVGSRSAFVRADWGAALQTRFDLIVSNPPYIPTGDIAGLDPEVREHDPWAALDGGADGLSAYRAIFADADRLLAPDGVAVVEFGIGQEADIRGAASTAKLRVVAVEQDLGRLPRVAVLRRF
jgi:release factor glutamine methyltransferase